MHVAANVVWWNNVFKWGYFEICMYGISLVITMFFYDMGSKAGESKLLNQVNVSIPKRKPNPRL